MREKADDYNCRKELNSNTAEWNRRNWSQTVKYYTKQDQMETRRLVTKDPVTMIFKPQRRTRLICMYCWAFLILSAGIHKYCVPCPSCLILLSTLSQISFFIAKDWKQKLVVYKLIILTVGKFLHGKAFSEISFTYSGESFQFAFINVAWQRSFGTVTVKTFHM